MENIPDPLAYLLASWGVISAMLVVLLIYRATLSNKEADQIYLNKAEEQIMATQQREIIGKINGLGRSIISLAVLSGILFVATAGMWLWTGLKSF